VQKSVKLSHCASRDLSIILHHRGGPISPISKKYFQKNETDATCIRRFEIKNFKTQKWVWMFLSYLVENFFLVIKS
jgi:hypothetical protein